MHNETQLKLPLLLGKAVRLSEAERLSKYNALVRSCHALPYKK